MPKDASSVSEMIDEDTLARLIKFRESLQQPFALGSEDLPCWTLRENTAFFEANDIGVQVVELRRHRE